MTLTFGSLFAGIGGIDLGFERAGMVGKWQVEIDPYARRVLAKHWPNVRRHNDIRTFPPEPSDDWRVDVIAGGFPCQDISYAGKGAGLHGERSGLFFELIRVVRVLGPRIIVLENVAALLTRGLDQVLGTLASLGYDAEWHCIPAAAVGAPHIRDRVFIISYRTSEALGRARAEWRVVANSKSSRQWSDQDNEKRSKKQEVVSNTKRIRSEVPDATQYGRQQGKPNAGGSTARSRAREEYRPRDIRQDGADTTSNLRRTSRHEMRSALNRFRSEDGRRQWSVEPDVGRVADGVPARVDRLRGLGNAVVPQVAEFIGRQIVEQFDTEGDE